MFVDIFTVFLGRYMLVRMEIEQGGAAGTLDVARATVDERRAAADDTSGTRRAPKGAALGPPTLSGARAVLHPAHLAAHAGWWVRGEQGGVIFAVGPSENT